MNNENTLVPKSIIDKISWPAFPGNEATSMLAMQFQLEKSQWWSPEELKKHQFIQLKQVMSHALQTVPFYRNFYAHMNKDFLKNLTDEWANIPLLKREHIQKAGKSMLSTNIPVQHGKIHNMKTSGSTGKPISVFGTQVTRFIWAALTLREHLWHKRDFGLKHATIRYIGENLGLAKRGLNQKSWGPSIGTVFLTGPGVVLNIDGSIQEQADWLIKQNPDYLLTHPTNALALARHFIDNNEVLPKLKEIRTLSEMIDEQVRIGCKNAWGVSVTDMYSTSEAGYIAFQCPEHEHYHVQSESVLVEILNETGEQCLPGEIGKVVLTNLHNFAFPLIRYDIGDYAEAGNPCPCGRGLPVIKNILGRVRNIMTLPNGEKKWPLVDYKKCSQVVKIIQMQTIQKSLKELEVKLVLERTMTDKEKDSLVNVMRTSLGYPFEISFSFHREIPRSKSGKFEDFISHVS